MRTPNEFQLTLSVLEWLQQTTHARTHNSVQCPEGTTQILQLTRDWSSPNALKKQIHITDRKPYTHIYTVKPLEVMEAVEFIRKHVSKNQNVCVFVIQDRHTNWAQYEEQITQVISVYEHRIVAQANGVKVVRTIGRVGRLGRGMKRDLAQGRPKRTRKTA